MRLEEFLPIFEMRSSKLMWLLGAGASASSGIPTAGDMIWDFKRKIYCAHQRVSQATLNDLADPAIQNRIQSFFNAKDGAPEPGSDEEYSYFFSQVYSDESDRRKYIHEMALGKTPSFGHLCLATLFKASKSRIVWTTNFDRVIEDACTEIFKTTGAINTISIENASGALTAYTEERWPLLIKLHGDFQSQHLKNTTAELQEQDEKLRELLLECSRQYGLIVSGYSGRDKSVMDTLMSALNHEKPFPSGIFWVARSEGGALPCVQEFIDAAKAKGVDAHIIQSETFDELLGDLTGVLSGIPKELFQSLQERRSRVSPAPLPTVKGTHPIIRLNAVAISSYPSTCRLVRCEIGGTSEVREAIADSNAQIIAARRKAGVILFGNDEEAKRAFDKFSIKELDLHNIELKRFFYDSAELGMVQEALATALKRQYGVEFRKSRGRYIVYFPKDSAASKRFAGICKTPICGNVPQSDTYWSEASEIKIELRQNTLWLVINPTIWADADRQSPNFDKVREFKRERQATRYNLQWNSMLAYIPHLIGA